MVNLETIAALAAHAQAAGEFLTVETGHCLNMRWKDAGCSLCWDICPTQAIHATRGDRSESGGHASRPELDAQACVRCGLCLRACPTGVFSDATDKPQMLVEAVQRQKPGTAMLVCSRVIGEQIDTPSDVQAVIRAPRCLAGIDLATLVTLAAERVVVLDDAPCVACPIERNREAFAAAASQANALLTAFEARGRIRLTDPQTSHRSTKRPIVSANQRVMSRRGFFSALTGRAREAGAAMIEETLGSSKAAPVDDRLEHHLPADRRRLLGALSRLTKEPSARSVNSENLPWTLVVVDREACVACGLCAKFCPTGAITFSTGEDKFVLNFQLGLCVDCGICAKACPVATVSYAAETPLQHLTTPRALAEGVQVKCARCGAPTASTSRDGLCFVCRKAAFTQSWFAGLTSAQDSTRRDADNQ